jgi:hypothetical protein
MTPRYEPGDILYHQGSGFGEFYCLVMDIEYKTRPDASGRKWPFDVYILLGMDDGETYKISTQNIDCSVYYKKVA